MATIIQINDYLEPEKYLLQDLIEELTAYALDQSNFSAYPLESDTLTPEEMKEELALRIYREVQYQVAIDSANSYRDNYKSSDFLYHFVGDIAQDLVALETYILELVKNPDKICRSMDVLNQDNMNLLESIKAHIYSLNLF